MLQGKSDLTKFYQFEVILKHHENCIQYQFENIRWFLSLKWMEE